MGAGPIILAVIVVIAAVIWFTLGPTHIYCEGCEIIPNKQSELDVVFQDACTEFQLIYRCDLLDMDQVSRNYAEFGQAEREYSVLSLCHLKNNFYTDVQCASLCECEFLINVT